MLPLRTTRFLALKAHTPSQQPTKQRTTYIKLCFKCLLLIPKNEEVIKLSKLFQGAREETFSELEPRFLELLDLGVEKFKTPNSKVSDLESLDVKEVIF